MLVLSLGFILQLVPAVEHFAAIIWSNSVTLFLFEPIDLGLLIVTW